MYDVNIFSKEITVCNLLMVMEDEGSMAWQPCKMASSFRFWSCPKVDMRKRMCWRYPDIQYQFLNLSEIAHVEKQTWSLLTTKI